jgi:effector-binding domain-containing protein
VLKIGDFSRLGQVTVKTLRYYDDIGLLRPVRVDPFTGYRFYSVDQLPRLFRILALKELDLSLEQIGWLLDGGLPASEMRGMLRLKQVELQERVQEEQGRLARVEARLRQIEQEGKMPGYDVVIKRIEPQTVATLREVIPSYDESGRLYEELFGYLGRQGARPAGPPFSTYHDREYKEQDPDVEAAVPVLGRVSGNGRIEILEMPGIEVAATVHHGGYETIGQAYSAVMAWIEANGYQVAGPNREVYLKGPGAGSCQDLLNPAGGEARPDSEPSGGVTSLEGGPSPYLTEIQYPVTK